MELRQLEHLVCVIRTQSFSLAARELRVTQPTLTRSIRALERRVGSRLLERGRLGSRPTAAGVELYRHALRIMNDYRRATEEVVAVNSGSVGKVSIGVGASYINSAMEAVCAQATVEMPSLELVVLEGLVENLIGPLVEGGIDMILTTFAPTEPRRDLVLEPLVRVTPMVVAGASHPLVRKRAPIHEDLLECQWASMDQPYTLDVLARLFTAQRRPAPRLVRTNSLSLLKDLVASGQFLALLPERAVMHELRSGVIKRIPIEIRAAPLYAGLFYLDRPVRSTAAERMLQLIREVCSREDA
jgi:DNA-binding transcriptional LysR family regulator